MCRLMINLVISLRKRFITTSFILKSLLASTCMFNKTFSCEHITINATCKWFLSDVNTFLYMPIIYCTHYTLKVYLRYVYTDV
jgi:hypothetical protein